MFPCARSDNAEMPRRSPSRLPRARALPVVGIAGVAFATIGISAGGTNWALVSLAAAYTALLAGAARAVRWHNLPPAALLVLPVGCDGLIAMLRHAQGGSTSGYGALTILPVVWAALALGRRAVLLLIGCTASVLVFPIVFIGAPDYPSTGWRGAVLLTVVAGVVGLVTDRVLTEQHRLAKLAGERARALDRILRTQRTIATTEPDLEQVMATVVSEAIELTNAEGAVVEIPDGGDIVYRSVAGSATSFLGLRQPAAGSISGLCIETGNPLVVADCETDARVDAEACREIGARSLVVVPLVNDGRTAGVLKVFSSAAGAVGADEARVLGLLGHVIGTGLARAELVEMLAEHAQTDKLTGLSNRRSWDDQLARAMHRAVRAGDPLSVAICDVDGLKRVNDEQGHAAGDALLQAVAGTWRGAARLGDLVARIGGDEFAILLYGADESTAEAVLERLAAHLPDGCSAPGGVAEWDGSESAAELLERADEQMYERKRERRRTLASGRQNAAS